MTITTLPALNRSSPTFKADVDTFFGSQLPTFSTEVNTEIDRINQIGFGSYSATSTTSLTVGTGTKNLTIEAGKGFTAGQAIIVAETAAPANYMLGQVTSYDSGTGALVFDSTLTGGSGTASAWSIGVAAIDTGTAQIGDIVYSNNSPGAGWLQANGQIYLKAAYPALANVLGTLWCNLNDGLGVIGTPASKAPSALKWLNGQFVLLTATTTDSSQVYTSPDGGAFTARTSSETNYWADIEYGDGYYVAVAITGANRVMRSTDAITWVNSSAAEANNWYSLAYNGSGTFVAVSNTGTNRVMRSTTAGATWTGVNVPGHAWLKIIWTGTEFVAFASNRVMKSSDGVTWLDYSTNTALLPDKTIFDGKIFIGVSQGGSAYLIQSSDGITWSTLARAMPAGVVPSIQYLHYSNKTYFIAFSAPPVTPGINVAFSHDLFTWWHTWLAGYSTVFSPTRLCLAPNGNLVGVSSAASDSGYRKMSNYDTSTQFMLPLLGNNAYIKAE